MSEVDRVFTELTMLIHTKCINFAYDFMDQQQRDFIADIYLCRYIYCWRV